MIARICAATLLIGASFTTASVAVADDAQADLAFFERDVLPILKARCYECHSHEAGKSKGGLVVDSRAGLLTGGSSGPAVVVGKPEQSLLLSAVRREDPNTAMPPDEALAAAEVKILEQWIQRGLPDSRKPTAALDPFEQILRRAQTHWSLQPIVKPTPPAAADDHRRRNEIDDFVFAEQRRAGLQPADDAEPRDLIRRLYFDLVGLPPTFEQVEAFRRDYAADADRAIAAAVDQLLASPHYGERWGRYWLDLARFAEISGGAANRARETRLLNAYTYRDYVLRALNEDKPYDRFVLEQLAADQLELADRRDLAALGFLPIGSQEGTAFEVRAERIDTIGKVFLGLSIGCARCHDHKFDPISTEDFYALDGVLLSCDEVGVPRPRDPVGDLQACPIIVEQSDPKIRAEYESRVTAARRAVAEYEEELWGPTERKWRELTPRVWEVLGLGAADFGPLGEREYLRKQELPITLITAWRRWLADQERDYRRQTHPIFEPWFRLQGVSAAEFSASAAKVFSSLADDGTINRRVMAVLSAQPLKSKRELARAYGALFAGVDREWQSRTGDQTALADADHEALRQVLYAPGMPAVRHGEKWRNEFGNSADTKRNQLLARLNDALCSHAGAPDRAMLLRDRAPQDAFLLVRGEPDQRGDRVPRGFLSILGPNSQRQQFAGERSGRLPLAQAIVAPTNPLTARVLVNRVWGRHFGRPLVDAVDDFGMQTPEPRQRALLDWLAATFVEDGWSWKKLHRRILLSRTYRLSSVAHEDYAVQDAADPDNALIWRANVRRLDFEAIRDSVLTTCGTLEATIGGRSTDVVADPQSGRRTIYAWINRPLQPLLSTFDVPDNSVTAAGRHESTSPGQALFLMNGGFLDYHAEKLLESAELRDVRSWEERLNRIFERVLQRRPTSTERARIARLVASEGETTSSWKRVVQALLMSNEFAYVL